MTEDTYLLFDRVAGVLTMAGPEERVLLKLPVVLGRPVPARDSRAALHHPMRHP